MHSRRIVGQEPAVLTGGREAPAVALDEHTALLAATFDRSPMGVAVFDTDLRYRLVNPALARINGVPAAQHLGRRVPELLPRMDDSIEGLLRRVLETGEPAVGVLNHGRTPADPDHEHIFEVAYYRLGGSQAARLGVSAFVVDVTARQAAVDEVAASRFRLRLLSDANSRVGSTLDVRRTAGELLRVVVPRFADCAVVDVLAQAFQEPDEARSPGPPARLDAVRRVATAGFGRPPPAVTGPVSQPDAARYPDGSPALRALREGRALALHAADGSLPGGNGRSLGLPAAVRSAVVAPLLAHGHPLGVVVFARVADRVVFDRDDLVLAAQLATRAALALDNARLYTRERATAIGLQRSLLPHDRPDLNEVTVARRYLPAHGDTDVAGDWFDVIPLPGGRVALTVGDVMGRGMRAAASMGQLRTAVRTLAVLDPLPEDVLAHLDELVQSLDQAQLATCVYAVYDAVGRQLRYASAGHLPPVLMASGEPARLLEVPSGAPLGVGGVAFEGAVADIVPETRILLYTDGLVESRGRDLDRGLTRLLSVLTDSPGDLERLCDHVLRRMGRGVADGDDVALLAARLDGVPRERLSRWDIDPDVTAVSVARRLTRERLVGWHLEGLVETATLLVSELVTNAIHYAREPIEVRLLLLRDRVEIAVADSDSRLPRLRRFDPEGEGGRGLHLVGNLARRWGARSTVGGKAVWFDLPLPGAIGGSGSG
jgi:PAS domain S-box-containing protein